MDHNQKYIISSLELHLFFARIMKEHALFLKAGFTPENTDCANEAERFKQKFEQLLCRAVSLSNGVVSQNVLRSGELVTEFTSCAEKQTQCYTGICINGDITALEHCLRYRESACVNTGLCRHVKHLNQTAIELLDGLIALKERILRNVLCCKMFTMNYPLLLEHIIREAKLYRTFLCDLECGKETDFQNMKQVEQFWNQIMMEHALFIRGLLDPCENELIETSDAFAKQFAALLASCRQTYDQTLINDSKASLETAQKFRDFKTAGTQGIQECKIRSIILPLLADHVLREANHYIRLLSE